MAVRLSLLKNGQRIALDDVPPPILEESEQVQFELTSTSDADAVGWRIRLGDLLPERPQGIDLGNVVRWERAPWFDCCRGRVQITLERNASPDPVPFSTEGWEEVLRAPVLIRPSKITEDDWITMRGDLEAVAVDLASDLVGKATAGLAHAMAGRTPLDELVAARKLLSRFERAMVRIVEQPHAVLRTSPELVCAPPRRLDGTTIKQLLDRGVNPRRVGSTSARFVRMRPRPSVDVPEHRQMLGTLHAVARALTGGISRAQAEIEELEGDRMWRERPGDAPGTSLYGRFDLPRIQRLRRIIQESKALHRRALSLADNELFAGLLPEQRIRPSLVSRHLAPYRTVWRAICAWSAAGRVQVDSGVQVSRKDTARMYEQWLFLQLASAVRNLGFKLDKEEDVFRRLHQRRFLMDLPRGAHLCFHRIDGVRLDLYFEPWIRPRDVALRMDEMFFHGRGREAAWSPDVLLTLQTTPDDQLNGIIIDAKYTNRLNDTHWSGVHKYFQIRRTPDGQQAIGQVWLSAPGVDGIRFDDDSISWTSSGPDIPFNTGIIQGEIGISPALSHRRGEAVPIVQEFLIGLLAHVGVSHSSELP